MRAMALIGIIALAGCAVSTEDGVDVDPITDRIGDWEASLAAQGNSGVLGTVAARSAAATSAASITISGAQSGARHPWHIHRGTCGSNGPIVGDASAYPVLVAGSNGVASASAELDVHLDEDGAYYVNVHRSPSDLGTIISCGALRP